jgi:hypothetical protein
MRKRAHERERAGIQMLFLNMQEKKRRRGGAELIARDKRREIYGGRLIVYIECCMYVCMYDGDLSIDPSNSDSNSKQQ